MKVVTFVTKNNINKQITISQFFKKHYKIIPSPKRLNNKTIQNFKHIGHSIAQCKRSQLVWLVDQPAVLPNLTVCTRKNLNGAHMHHCGRKLRRPRRTKLSIGKHHLSR